MSFGWFGSIVFGSIGGAILSSIVSSIAGRTSKNSKEDRALFIGICVTMLIGCSCSVYFYSRTVDAKAEIEILEAICESYEDAAKEHEAEIDTIKKAHEEELVEAEKKGYESGYGKGFGDGKNTNPVVYETKIPKNLEEAYELGYWDGYENGFIEGTPSVTYNDGYDEGYNCGYDNGYEAGYDIGYSDGSCR